MRQALALRPRADGGLMARRAPVEDGRQLQLHGFGMPARLDLRSLPPGNERLFLAAFPDAEAALAMERYAEELRNRVGIAYRAQTRERMHASLLCLGDFAELPGQVIDTAMLAASKVRV